jgi:hypothetical protein
MKSKLLEVVILEMDVVADTPAPTITGEQMEFRDIMPRILKILQATSSPANSHIRLASEKPQLNTLRISLAPNMVLHWSHSTK